MSEPTAQLLGYPRPWLSLSLGCLCPQGVRRAEPRQTKASAQTCHGRAWLGPLAWHSGHSGVKCFTKPQPQAWPLGTWKGRSQQRQPKGGALPAERKELRGDQPHPARTGAKGLTKAAVLIKCPKRLVLPPVGRASGKCQR